MIYLNLVATFFLVLLTSLYLTLRSMENLIIVQVPKLIRSSRKLLTGVFVFSQNEVAHYCPNLPVSPILHHR